MSVLIASCIRQKPEILKEFLDGLDRLKKPEIVDYFFILNELDEESRGVFDAWMAKITHPVTYRTMDFGTPYVRDEETHRWSEQLVSNVIEMKNQIIKKAKDGEYDYLLFIDSDNILHPDTLMHLLETKKDIVTEICWTKWTPAEQEMPNAWFTHPYGFPDNGLKRLRDEKLLKVAGFGGLYLISKKVLDKGVTFWNRVEGMPKTYWGEDRHFALRAKQAGFDLWCDTTIPTFHIYRESDLPRLQEWKKNGCIFGEKKSVGSGVLIVTCLGEGGINPDTVTWLIRTLRIHPNWGLNMPRGHPIDSNRNAAVERFMVLPEASGYDWLLFLDSDIVPPDFAVERLLSYGKKIVGGVCSIMGSDGFITINISKELPPGRVKAELIEVRGMGTGFMLIHRDVFKKVGKSPFRFRYNKWGVANVCGEDYDFCEKAIKKGFKVYADLSTQCEHYKTMGLMSLNNRFAEAIDEARSNVSNRPA